MRAQAVQNKFAVYLLKIRNDEIEKLPGSDLIPIPTHMVVTGLTEAIYEEDFSEQAMRNKSGCAILAPKNKHCNKINEMILSKLPGEERIYHSIDSIATDSPTEMTNYPI